MKRAAHEVARARAAEFHQRRTSRRIRRSTPAMTAFINSSRGLVRYKAPGEVEVAASGVAGFVDAGQGVANKSRSSGEYIVEQVGRDIVILRPQDELTHSVGKVAVGALDEDREHPLKLLHRRR